MEEIVAQRNVKNHKKQLSTRELKQLILWGGLLLIIFLGLVYGLVRTGAIIPGTNGLAPHGANIHGIGPGSQP
jgi:hypothetical protein